MTIKNLELNLDDISMMQLGDSFFPTGMYTTSSGLEAMFYNRERKSKQDIYEFISVCLKYQLGPADCVALSNAFEAAQISELKAIQEIDDLLFCMKLVKEIRDASTRSGTQLMNCVLSFINDNPNSNNSTTQDDISNPNTILSSYYKSVKNKNSHGVYPVALAVVSNALKISKDRACLLLLYGFTVSIVGAALRLGMFPHFEGQQIIHSLRPIMLEVINENIGRTLSKMWQFSPGIDILQISHERMDSKMFIT